MHHKETVEVLCDFLETAIHFILWVREVYPPNLFEKRKKYNVPVHMSRHPELNSYIHEVIAAMKPDMFKGTLERIYLVILSPQTPEQPVSTPLERFVFEIRSKLAGSISMGAGRETTDQSQLSVKELEQMLRQFLVKLSVCDAVLHSNPANSTFCIMMQLRDDEEKPATGVEFPWVNAEVSMATMSNSQVMPLKSLDTGPIKMQLVVQESREKQSFLPLQDE